MSQSAERQKQALMCFMQETSVEVTPLGAAKIQDFAEILRPGCTVYVTFLPGSDFEGTIETVRRLQEDGYRPVPHFAARSLVSEKLLERYLAVLQGELGITEGLLVAGGVDKPLGVFGSSIEVLRTGLFEKYGFTSLGLAGHPEGSPDIPEADCALAIRQKNEYARETDMTLYLATQFVFEAAPLLTWEKNIRAHGNRLPICAGIPGLATIKTLLSYAKQCGVGSSMRFLTRRPIDLLRLSLKGSLLGNYFSAPHSEPSQLLRDLSSAISADPECLIRRCHIYPLGGLKKSAEWMYKVKDGNFVFNSRGFKIE